MPWWRLGAQGAGAGLETGFLRGRRGEHIRLSPAGPTWEVGTEAGDGDIDVRY